MSRRSSVSRASHSGLSVPRSEALELKAVVLLGHGGHSSPVIPDPAVSWVRPPCHHWIPGAQARMRRPVYATAQ